MKKGLFVWQLGNVRHHLPVSKLLFTEITECVYTLQGTDLSTVAVLQV